jgi:hypothetical protein
MIKKLYSASDDLFYLVYTFVKITYDLRSYNLKVVFMLIFQALGVPVDRLVEAADSVSVCFSFLFLFFLLRFNIASVFCDVIKLS